jgi:hypothetical protein
VVGGLAPSSSAAAISSGESPNHDGIQRHVRIGTDLGGPSVSAGPSQGMEGDFGAQESSQRLNTEDQIYKARERRRELLMKMPT